MVERGKQQRLSDPEGVIPPRSIVELVRADKRTPSWKGQVGKRFRIGYYVCQDGLDVIWLVDEKGSYRETTDHDFLRKYFRIVRLSKETDYYGVNRPPLRPLRPRPKARGK